MAEQASERYVHFFEEGQQIDPVVSRKAGGKGQQRFARSGSGELEGCGHAAGEYDNEWSSTRE